MPVPRPQDGARVVILSGGGLSAASEIPPFRDAEGRWEGHPVDSVASLEGWRRDPELVRRFYDTRRLNCIHVLPNAAHDALSRLQHRWGVRRVVLATRSIDGLLTKAGAADVIDLLGSLWTIRCEADFSHPHLQVAGPQGKERRCPMCKAVMRPDVSWPGEPMRQIERLTDAIRDSVAFVCVGLSADDAPLSDLLSVAREAGVPCVEVNTTPSGIDFDEIVQKPAEEVLPEMVAEWLKER